MRAAGGESPRHGSPITTDAQEPPGPLLDSHCHAWRLWPYASVPDASARASAELLLSEMDLHGVAEALVVCAAITNNPDNLEYVAAACERNPTRLHLIAELDCSWSETYHVPGSAERLRRLCERHELTGVTHYLADRNDGWLRGKDADAVFGFAAERRLLISLGASAVWQEDLRVLARRHPSVPVLCHALGLATAAGGDASSGMAAVLASAEVPNIYLKVAGLPYCAQRPWDYPWPDVLGLLAEIFDSYGAGRLCWGSDFPASTRYCTFRQSIEVLRTHCPFIAPRELRMILGGTLHGLLSEARIAA
jgi:L-fuconolactonase